MRHGQLGKFDDDLTCVRPAPSQPSDLVVHAEAEPPSGDPESEDEQTEIMASPYSGRDLVIRERTQVIDVAKLREQASLQKGSPQAVEKPDHGPNIGPLSPLFRQKAIAAYMRNEHDGVLVGSAPRWGRKLIIGLGVLHAVALALSFIVRIDLTSRGPGTLRTPGDLQIVTAQASGPIAEVRAHSGDAVQADEVLAVIDSAAMKSSLVEADKKIELLTARVEAFQGKQKEIFDRRVVLLRRRADLLRKRIASQGATASRIERKVAAYRDLEEGGYVPRVQADEVGEELAQAARHELGMQEELSQTLAEISSLEAGREDQRLKVEDDLRDAKDKRDALNISLEQAEVKAPRAGYVEALLVKSGDVVKAGSSVAKIVQSTAPTQVIAFIPERDRAFLKEGVSVRLEIEQLPTTEFGTLTGKVARIAGDIASSYELADAFGDKPDVSGPVYRVEITIDDAAKGTALYKKIRSGGLVTVRFPLRSIPLIVMAFEPVRRWLNR